jgi:hypothetical protein
MSPYPCTWCLYLHVPPACPAYPWIIHEYLSRHAACLASCLTQVLQLSVLPPCLSPLIPSAYLHILQPACLIRCTTLVPYCLSLPPACSSSYLSYCLPAYPYRLLVPQATYPCSCLHIPTVCPTSYLSPCLPTNSSLPPSCATSS